MQNEQVEQLKLLSNLYAAWNEKVNLISRKDLENIWERHILHSLLLPEVIRFKKGTVVLDAGTGGGFPGIPLSIFFPETEFFLVDSIGKKIKAVAAIANELGLKNVRAMQGRVEELPSRYDFVVGRAVTALPRFVNWVEGKIKPEGFNDYPNGIFYLKGGDFPDEIRALKRNVKVFDLVEFCSLPFFDTKKLVYVPVGREIHTA